MGKYSRLGKNTVFVFIGNAGSKLINLILLPLYTVWMSVEEYASTDLINVYSTLLVSIVSFNLFEAAFVFPKSKPIKDQKRLFSSGISMIIGSFFIFLIIISMCYYAGIIVQEGFIISNIWNISILIGLMILQSFLQQFLRGINQMKGYSTAGVILTASILIISFILIPKLKVKGYILTLIISNLIVIIYMFFSFNMWRYFSLKFINKEDCKSMLSYSLPLVPNNISLWIINALNRPILESYVGLFAVGLLAVANKVPATLHLIYQIFQYSWQISVLEEFRKEDFNLFYNKIFRFLFTGLILFACIVAAGSELIIYIIADNKFHESWKYVSFLNLSVLFSCVSGFVGSIFIVIRKSKYFFYSTFFGSIISFILNFIFIPKFAIWGAILSTVIAQLVTALLRLKYSWKYAKINNVNIYINMIVIYIFISSIFLYFDSYLYKITLFTICISLFFTINIKFIDEIKCEILKKMKK